MAASEATVRRRAMLVQHRRRLPWQAPIEAYRRLRHQAPVLLDAAGLHPDARRAYLALSPAWEARCGEGVWHMARGGRLDTSTPGAGHPDASSQARGEHDTVRSGGADRHTLPGDTLDVLRHICEGMRFPVKEEGFTGGLVGYFGYGFTHAIERSLSVATGKTPDAVLWLCRDAVVFDMDQQEAWLWTADLPGESDAAERAQRIEDVWLSGLEPVAVEPGATGEVATESGARGTVVTGPGPTGAVSADAPTAPGDAVSPAHPATDAPDGVAAAPAASDPDGHAASAADEPWRTSMDQAQFMQAADHVRELVVAGDLYQANIATRFSRTCDQEPADLMAHLRRDNPSPFMAIVDAGDHVVVSCSPEQLMKVEGGIISSRPIAGTRQRGRDEAHDAAMERELLGDPKEQAEHTMLVDLLRNDIAKVSVPGSVHVPERMSVERYRHVMHLVSRVEGQLRPGTDFVDWLAALFPGGTITGAPKHRACMRIAEAEPVARGAYTGSAGYLSWSHNTQWNILIRTIVLEGGMAHVHAGSGIVADSDPRREWKEAVRKAQALLDAATQGATGGGDRLGDVTRHGDWRPPKARGVLGRRVLLIDNYDSFTHNLADAVAATGASVEVVRNDADWQAAWEGLEPTHAIISPGPGEPKDSGASLALLAWLRDYRPDVPVLGVCLGHQAMALVDGGEVGRVAPVHGRTDEVHHDGSGLFAGLASPLTATRYHSLAVTSMPDGWRRAAWLADGTLMAMVHGTRPWWGLQFHPESLCTDTGVEIVARFLEVEHGRHRVR